MSTENDVTSQMEVGFTEEELKAQNEFVSEQIGIGHNLGFSAGEISKALASSMRIVEENTYRRYNIITTQHHYENKFTTQYVKDLKRGGTFTLGSHYKVTPHEQLIEFVQNGAKELDIELKLVKDKRTAGSYYNLRNEEGMTVSRNGRFMCTSFVVKDNATVDVFNGDRIESGITIINSLDGSTATYTIPMSYRLLCSNEIPHMMRSIYASGRKLMEQFRALATLTWHSRKVLQHKYATFEDYLAEATKSRFVHNVKPDPDLLMNSIALQLEQVKTILPIYKKLATTKLTKKRVEQIIGISTPETSAMPISLTKELRPNTAGVIATRKDKEWKLVEVDENMTEYDLLNEYSFQLTHHPNVRSSVVSNLGHYEKLHRHFFSPHQQILTVPN
tara:strand:- start:1605 stop:2774 length:1170 start_codon:yes stop_codon:yes gene_type:complete